MTQLNAQQIEALTGTADLHIHTTASDGLSTVKQVLDYTAEQTSLDVIAITDHDVLDASLWAAGQQKFYPFDIVPGVEVTSHDGHVLALWVTQPVPMGLSLAETVAEIHRQGGLAIVAHPFEPMIAPLSCWRYLHHPSVLEEAKVDGVETMNAGALTPGGSRLARAIFTRRQIAVTGGSDAHMDTCIGTGITRFVGRTAADLRRSIELGQTAVEGKRWHLSTYFRHFSMSRQMKRNASLATSAP
jgi:hypothetical protein